MFTSFSSRAAPCESWKAIRRLRTDRIAARLFRCFQEVHKNFPESPKGRSCWLSRPEITRIFKKTTGGKIVTHFLKKKDLKIFLQKLGFQQGYQTTLEDIQLPFDSVPVWTKVHLKLPDIQELDTEIKNDDAFYAHPNKNRFDTILINISNSSNNFGLKGELY